MSNLSISDLKVPNKTQKMIQLERLRALCRSPDSAISMVKRPVHLALQPAYLGNINAGIFNILNTKLNKYYPELKGILMGYDKIRLKKRNGSISNDQPFIHIDVQAEFYVFNPKKGVPLRGRVNKKSPGHVGCLVHDVFNAAITPPVGVDLSLWCGARAEIGKQITFITTAVSYGDKLPIIQGRLEEEGLGIEQDGEEEAIQEVEEFEETRNADYDSGIDSIGKSEKRKRDDDEEEEHAKKKRRKAEKKKRKEREEAEKAASEALALNASTADTTADEIDSEKVKKKKKKNIETVISEEDKIAIKLLTTPPVDTAPKPSTPVKSSEISNSQTPQTSKKVTKVPFEVPEGWRIETKGQGTKRLYKIFISPQGKSFYSLAQVQRFVESSGEKRVEIGQKVEKELEGLMNRSTKVNSEQLDEMVNFVSVTWNRNFDNNLMSDNPEFYKNPALRLIPNKPEFVEPESKPARKMPKAKDVSKSPPKIVEPEVEQPSFLSELNAFENPESQSPKRPLIDKTDKNDTTEIQDESLSTKKEKKKKKKKDKEKEKNS